MLRRINNPKKRIRISLLLLYDVMAIFMSEYMALLIRYEFRPDKIKPEHLKLVLEFSVLNILLTVFIFSIFSLYESLWRYASVTELLNLTLACLVSAGVQLIVMYMLETANSIFFCNLRN